MPGPTAHPGTAAAHAVVFPGLTGTTFAALGRFLVHDRHARPLVRLADAVLGGSLLTELRDSTDDYSPAAQVAALVSGLALVERVDATLSGPPALIAGPSFGVRALAVHSGAIEVAEGIRLAAAMARREQEYFRTEHSDVLTHTVVRVPADGLAELVADWTARGDRLELSGDLAPGFAMLTLRAHLLEPLKQAISDLGGYSTATMGTPAHSTLFAGLRAAMAAEVLADAAIGTPAIPVVRDYDGAVITDAEGVRGMLADTFDRPFRWQSVLDTLHANDIGTLRFAGADALFSRLDNTVRAFAVVKADPKQAARPAKPEPLVGATA
ncbi:ACP S-malonyltransferase [Crossiella cryophila]|uniref:[acyl-carrier-protein] S-malonyltransferase n=1 Tax=Crossiella cryophila TaxID=43355 RepID=A0A7W7CEA7_9PSEU|nr:ACP S-malonyltransferase [Crossiella cryophila]MBB4679600.1 [acyl-carrier-protein] S-malonyltransferase [Crossiella cryophila]